MNNAMLHTWRCTHTQHKICVYNSTMTKAQETIDNLQIQTHNSDVHAGVNVFFV